MSVDPIIDTMPVREQVINKIERYALQAESRYQQALSFSIDSVEDRDLAMCLIGESKDIADRIDAERKEIIEPHRKIVNAVNDTAKLYTEKLKMEQSTYLKHIDAWKAKEVANQAIREAEAKEIKDALGLDVAPYAKEDLSVIRAPGVRAQEKEEIMVELEDITKVPIDYLLLDEKKVKAVAKAGIRNIPGVKLTITTKTQIVRR
jgi:hypothetical protein